MQPPEDVLLARCRAGDVEAFGQVYARYEQVVFRHAYHLLGDRDEAHDVRQETFIKAYGAVRRFRGECSLKTWLLMISTNLCRSRLRSRRRQAEVSWNALDLDLSGRTALYSDGIDPHAAAEQSQMAEIVRRALDTLPAAHREVIVLRDVEGLSAEETARVLGCSRASVAVKLFRAHALLRARLRALLGEGS